MNEHKRGRRGGGREIRIEARNRARAGRGDRPYDVRRAGRMRRGDIRTALLLALAEQPGHGYEVIQTIEQKSDGAWKPSPGSVYPTLQLLEDEGLLRSTERDGKRVYEITDEGRTEAERRTDEAGGPPWDAARGVRGHGELKQAMVQLHLASKQVAVMNDPDLAEKAVAIVKDARKQLYRLLADA